jgi:hypothetical protein
MQNSSNRCASHMLHINSIPPARATDCIWTVYRLYSKQPALKTHSLDKHCGSGCHTPHSSPSGSPLLHTAELVTNCPFFYSRHGQPGPDTPQPGPDTPQPGPDTPQPGPVTSQPGPAWARHQHQQQQRPAVSSVCAGCCCAAELALARACTAVCLAAACCGPALAPCRENINKPIASG